MGIKYRLGLEGMIEMAKEPLGPAPTGKLLLALADNWLVRRLYDRMLDGVPEDRRRRLRELTETPVDVEAMLRLPESTFGHQFVTYMLGKGYDMNGWHIVYPEVNELLREFWVLRRFVKVHDIIHVLLGIEISPAEEIGLQLFHSVNFKEPFGLLATATLPVVALHHGEPVEMVRQLVRGARVGRQVDNLFVAPLEDMFGEDLVEVRRKLRIPPGGAP
ncbi:MAG: hypothetical protein IT372_15345 [Polyangiaceae bacterium]|nr:hypothetical protein [Polyangiaceae bacterium]